MNLNRQVCLTKEKKHNVNLKTTRVLNLVDQYRIRNAMLAWLAPLYHDAVIFYDMSSVYHSEDFNHCSITIFFLFGWWYVDFVINGYCYLQERFDIRHKFQRLSKFDYIFVIIGRLVRNKKKVSTCSWICS